MSLQYYDSDNEALIPIAGNVNPSDVIELKASKADKTQISNPNLLNNPWFIVNQRGQSSYSIPADTNMYTADRWAAWKGTNGTFTVGISGGIGGVTLTVSADASDNAFRQFVIRPENLGRVMTASIILDGILYSATGTLPQTHTSSWQTGIWRILDNGFEFGVNVTPNNVSFDYEFILRPPKNGTTYSITACKLELGTQSTLAMDAAPNYALELIKCQRYYYRINNKVNGNNIWKIIGIGHYRPTDLTELYITYPVIMRTNPSIVITNYSDMIVGDTSDQTISSYTINSSQVDSAAISFTTTASPVANGRNCVEVWMTSNGESTIEFSADL